MWWGVWEVVLDVEEVLLEDDRVCFHFRKFGKVELYYQLVYGPWYCFGKDCIILGLILISFRKVGILRLGLYLFPFQKGFYNLFP